MSLTLAGATLLGAGISATASTGSSFFNALSQKRQNELNYKYNKQLQDEAFRQNKYMIEMQNFYNSPSAQMARYQAAGVNPNVLYGEAQDISSGSQNAAPELTYPAYQAKAPVFDFDSPMQQLLAAAQINNLNAKTDTEDQMRPVLLAKTIAQTENLEQQTQELVEKITGLRIDNDIKDKTKGFVIEYAALQNEFIQAETRAVESREKLNYSEIAKNNQIIAESKGRLDKLIEEAKNLQEYRNKIMPSEAARNWSDVKLNKSMANYYDTAESKVYFEAEQEKNNSEHWEEQFEAYINEMRAKYNLNDVQTDNLRWEVRHKVWMEGVRPVAHDILTFGGIIGGAEIAAGAKAGKAAAKAATHVPRPVRIGKR